MKEKTARPRSLKPSSKKRLVRFTLVNRRADDVRIAGDFNDWNQTSHPLECHQGDTWTIDIPLDAGSHEYLFLVDGSWETDPTTDSVRNPFGGRNSVVHISLQQRSAPARGARLAKAARANG